jgi:DNA adenine methylase
VSVSQSLTNGAQFKVCDFEIALTNCAEGDFVYLDPPYASKGPSSAFVDYNSKIFGWDDQMRLAAVFRELNNLGVSVIQSNVDHPSIRQLYDEFEVRTVSRYSSMAASSAKRGKSSELLILSDAILDSVPK